MRRAALAQHLNKKSMRFVRGCSDFFSLPQTPIDFCVYLWTGYLLIYLWHRLTCCTFALYLLHFPAINFQARRRRRFLISAPLNLCPADGEIAFGNYFRQPTP
jgi:hypothetical protein